VSPPLCSFGRETFGGQGLSTNPTGLRSVSYYKKRHGPAQWLSLPRQLFLPLGFGFMSGRDRFSEHLSPHPLVSSRPSFSPRTCDVLLDTILPFPFCFVSLSHGLLERLTVPNNLVDMNQDLRLSVHGKARPFSFTFLFSLSDSLGTGFVYQSFPFGDLWFALRVFPEALV